jgi:hypothetical protein
LRRTRFSPTGRFRRRTTALAARRNPAAAPAETTLSVGRTLEARMKRNWLVSATLVATFWCGAARGAETAQEQVPFSVKAGTFVFGSAPEGSAWSILVGSTGNASGDVGDVAFSRAVSASVRERLRVLAACVATSSEIGFGGCPMIEPPPPITWLNLQYGSKHVRSELCYPSVADGSDPATQAHSRAVLEMLITLRDLAPKAAYDYRSEFRAAATELPEMSLTCPSVGRPR